VNVLKPEEIANVATLLRAGLSYRKIQRQLGIRRETVSKYADNLCLSKAATGGVVATGELVKTGQLEGPRPPVKSEAVSACETHREWIEKQVGLGRNAVAIYQELVEQFGFDSKYNSVKRFVQKLKIKEPERYDVLEFLPGEEGQVDYGQGAKTNHPQTGKLKRPYLFVMTLRYSRKSFRKVVWQTNQIVWSKLHEEAFRSFGGCPQYIVLDNLKEGVIKPDLYEPKLNRVYTQMLSHYGVVADPARVRDPDRKGSVESAIKHTQDTALKGKEFNKIEEQNEWLRHWEEKWAAPRIHGRTKRQVLEMFEEERPFLKALPLESFKYFEEGIRTVDDSGMVQVKSSYYAALPADIGSEVIVRIYDEEIEIWQNSFCLRRHAKSSRKGCYKIEESDRIYNPSRETTRLLEKALKIGSATHALCIKFFEAEGRLGQKKIYGIVNLSRHHTRKVIEEGCEKALKVNCFSYQSLKRIVESIGSKGETEKQNLTQENPLIRPLSDYQQFFEINA
jgi:transposase